MIKQENRRRRTAPMRVAVTSLLVASGIGAVGAAPALAAGDSPTPAALHSYRATRKLSADRWTLLRGAPDDTLELAALLGVKFKREASGQFAHSNLITVLNAQGEIIHQLAGLNRDAGETVARISAEVAK